MLQDKSTNSQKGYDINTRIKIKCYLIYTFIMILLFIGKYVHNYFSKKNTIKSVLHRKLIKRNTRILPKGNH